MYLKMFYVNSINVFVIVIIAKKLTFIMFFGIY